MAANQQVTREWRGRNAPNHELFVSAAARAEISRGDAVAARWRLDLHRLFEEFRRLEREGGRNVVSFPPRPPLACDLPAKALPEPVVP